MINSFLSMGSSPKKKVIADIQQRRRSRVSKTRKGEYSFMDGINHFKKNKTLKFRDIDQAFLEKYKTFCSVYLNQKMRTITNQLIFIRTLFNIAIKDGIVAPKFYPFSGEKERIRIGSGNKIGLTIKEIEKIESLRFELQLSIWHTHNIWLIAFYFAGIRISDVVKLKWSDLKNNRLYYVMNKNEKPLSLKIPDKANTILNYYRKNQAENNGYIFPFLKDANYKDEEDIFRETRNATKLFNKYLK
ncbi:site-specific integrase [Antarcticibacterium sp. 1MA-6-2]|uniref:phage integrase SAM-like domain-containing protein n=1 Tax=Antarcticibacterium sp. 1MA-6-2 TaxID=2908210 RepID=UPI001F15E251|nr:phage integrase SAM-like domain-containing protein [Antarcticibacterium sp. 1MA-6-2]UJH90947.1 site-specific integrase [Antarcticibacterium sp. 1MA-6-2]